MASPLPKTRSRADRFARTGFFAALVLALFFLQNETRRFIAGGTAVVPLPAQYVGLGIRPEVIRRFLGTRLLAADLIWIDTLIKADIAHENVEYTTLYRVFQNMIDLDPDYLYGYYVAGIYLSVVKDDVNGGIRVFRQAVAKIDELKKRGLVWEKSWLLPFLLGFNLFFEKQEFLEGAHWIKTAAGYAEAPAYLKRLSDAMKDARGVYAVAGRILSAMLARSQREDEKERIREKLRQVLVEADLAELNARFQAFLRRSGLEISKAGLLERFLREESNLNLSFPIQELRLDSRGQIVREKQQGD